MSDPYDAPLKYIMVIDSDKVNLIKQEFKLSNDEIVKLEIPKYNNESTSKGKYFMITTKKYYKLAVKEKRIMDERQDYQRENITLIHSNVSTHSQALMLFHEDNPVATKNSNTRLKMQFREQTSTSKRDAPKEVAFLDIDDPTPTEEHIRMQPPQNVNRIPNPSDGRSQAGRGATGGRGGQGGRGSAGRKSSLKEPVWLFTSK